MNRDKLGAQANAFLEGKKSLEDELGQGTSFIKVKEHFYVHQDMVNIKLNEKDREKLEVHRAALIEGRKDGEAMERTRNEVEKATQRHIEWHKLFLVTFAGAFTAYVLFGIAAYIFTTLV